MAGRRSSILGLSKKKQAQRDPKEEYRQRQLAANALTPPGIINSANDCFMNSVLQALIATPILEDLVTFRQRSSPIIYDPSLSPALTNGRDVAGASKIEWTDGLRLSDTFLRFMEQAYCARDEHNKAPMNPKQIIREVGAKFDQYLDFGQQDAHELMRHLMDAMYMDEMDIIKKRQPPSDPKGPTDAGQPSSDTAVLSAAASVDGGESSATSERKLVPFTNAVFGGRLASFIICNTCKRISRTYEDFLDLSLSIRTDEEKKRSRFRAFAEKFKSSSRSNAADTHSRPSTPQGNRTTDGTDSTETNAPVEDNGLSSRIGRRMSLRVDRGRPSSSLSRPTSSERPAPDMASIVGEATKRQHSTHHLKEREKVKASPRKPTHNEAAYLRALLRDEPHHSHPHLTHLRSSSDIPSLSLPIPTTSAQLWTKITPGAVTVVDCLRMFTSVEVLDDENAFACHSCWKMANPDLAAAAKRKRQQRKEKKLRKKQDRQDSVVASSESSSSDESSSSEDSDDDALEPRPTQPLSLRRPSALLRRASSAIPMGPLLSIQTPSGSGLHTPASIASEPPISVNALSANDLTIISDRIKTQPRPDTSDTFTVSTTTDNGTHPAPSLYSTSMQLPSISTTSPPEAYDPDLPKFRRYSSFHAQKFLSPNASQDSVVSAPYTAIPQPNDVFAFRQANLEGLKLGGTSDVEEEVSGGESTNEEEDSEVSQTDLTSGSAVSMSGDTSSPSQPSKKSQSDVAFPRTPSVQFDPSSFNPDSSHLPPLPRRADRIIRRRAFKRFLIDTPPAILVVHLKRFQQTNSKGPAVLFSAGAAKKLEDYVSFPEVLDLQPFMAPKREEYGVNERGIEVKDGNTPRKLKHHHRHSFFGGGGKHEEEEKVKEGSSALNYRLYAVVVHIGSMLGGHYIAYTALPQSKVSHPEASERTSSASSSDAPTPSSAAPEQSSSASKPTDERQWCYISDTHVRLASRDEVMKAKAYLLYYERI